MLSDIERFIAYRTYDKYHIVNTGLEPSYYDISERLLHANFSLLKDFVECELAGLQLAFGNDKKKIPISFKIRRKMPALIERLFLPEFRSSSLGIDYINAQIKMYSKPIKYTSKDWRNSHLRVWNEVFLLYFWWDFRLNQRKEPEELSGLHKLSEKIREKYGKVYEFKKVEGSTSSEMIFVGDKKERKQYDLLIRKSWKIEGEQRKEDEDMLVRLVKIREYLWT